MLRYLLKYSFEMNPFLMNNKTEEFDLEKLGENERFLDIIRKEKIQTIHTKESTLEDIFIRVTGRNLS